MSPNYEKYMEVVHAKLCKVLEKSRWRSVEDSANITYALMEIARSVDHLYQITVPDILASENVNREILLEKIWDIREEFRHIQYHIDDAKLTD